MIFLAYYSLINLILLFLMVWDKRSAKKGNWRIKESTLLGLGFLGGGLGGLMGMKLAHHKTKKAVFWVTFGGGIALHLLAWLLIYIYIL